MLDNLRMSVVNASDVRNDRNIPIPCFSTEIVSANMLDVTVGTTGNQKEASCNASRTYFKFKNLGGMDMTVNVLKQFGHSTEEFEVLIGDDGLDTIIEALEYITSTLKSGRGDTLRDDVQ